MACTCHRQRARPLARTRTGTAPAGA